MSNEQEEIKCLQKSVGIGDSVSLMVIVGLVIFLIAGAISAGVYMSLVSVFGL